MTDGLITRRRRDRFSCKKTIQSADYNISQIAPASNICDREKLPANTFIVRILGLVHERKIMDRRSLSRHVVTQ
jgi:hypothetical protein